MPVPPLGQEDALERDMAAHTRILAWRVPRQRSLAGCSPRGRKESDTTDATARTRKGWRLPGRFCRLWSRPYAGLRLGRVTRVLPVSSGKPRLQTAKSSWLLVTGRRTPAAPLMAPDRPHALEQRGGKSVCTG